MFSHVTTTRRTPLASTRRNGPTCLNFSDIPVGVWKLSQVSGRCLELSEGCLELYEGCLEDVWTVFSGCIVIIYGVSKWCVGRLNASKGQVRTGQVRTGQVKTGQINTGYVRTGHDEKTQVRTG